MTRSAAACDTVLAHLPPAATGYVAQLLRQRSLAVRISPPRRTKLGDHRPPRRDERLHRISINDDLNPYAFLTTLLHEIAHADVWEAHRGRWRRPKPHGREWKAAFGGLLGPILVKRWLPPDVADALASFRERPTAASCVDRGLVLALARYDRDAASRPRVEDLRPGTYFRVDGGRVFRLGRRARTRYLCVEQGTGAEYRVHALAIAEVVAAPAVRGQRRGAVAR